MRAISSLTCLGWHSKAKSRPGGNEGRKENNMKETKNLKRAAEIIAESCREDCEEMGFKSIREMIKCYRMDKEDMLSEFVGALQDANADKEFYFTDDGEVFEANELTPHTFDELIAEVKKYKL